MTFIVATIDLDSASSPSYDELDNVMEAHGLFAPQPRAWGAIPRNTYLGKAPLQGDLHAFAQHVFDAVREAKLTPTRLLVVGTTNDNIAIVKEDM
jgi:hypothetical protein